MATPTPISDETNYTALLITLLALLIFSPLLDVLITGGLLSRLIMDGLVSAVLLSATYVVHRRKTLLIVSGVLLVPAILGRWTALAYPGHSLLLASNGLSFLFYTVTASAILAEVVQAKRVSLHVVNGAICVYLLMGVAWAMLYALVEALAPGSFNLPAVPPYAAPIAVVDPYQLRLFLYYSLVTLTTLGYGDITPISYPARNLSAAEAILGQLFIAVLIARLVGLSAAGSGQGEQDE